MPARVSLLAIYQQLPQTNCGECGEVNCMSFASKILERKLAAKDCPPLLKPEYKEKLEKIIQLVAPPIREVVIGKGENAVKIGGKEVLYRHELTFHDPTAIAIDVSDASKDEEILERCRKVEQYEVIRIGESLKLDLIALRCVSGDPKRFADVASLVAGNCRLPMILCSFDPSVLEAALRKKEVAESRPLLYAANLENWRDMGLLAKRYDCPLAVYAPKGLSELISIVKTYDDVGLKDLVLDPGTYSEGQLLKESLEKMVMVRRAAIKRDNKALGYPVMVVPAVVWLEDTKEPVTSYKESYLASVFITRFADLVVMHSLEPWAILPVITLRQNLYTDPRKPVAVDAGLRTIGTPSETSPVLITTNFALTYYTVANDIEAQGQTCYLLVADTGGIAVECAVAGGQLKAAGVKDLIAASGIESRVKHRKLVIPQLAARLRGDIEDETKWEVMVGPRDSSEIKDFLSKNWDIK